MIVAMLWLFAVGGCLAVAIWADEGLSADEIVGLTLWSLEDRR